MKQSELAIRILRLKLKGEDRTAGDDWELAQLNVLWNQKQWDDNDNNKEKQDGD